MHFLHTGASLSDCHTGAACVPVQRRGLDCLRRRGGGSQTRRPRNAAGQNGKAAALQIMQGAEGRGARHCTRLPGAVVTHRPPLMTFPLPFSLQLSFCARKKKQGPHSETRCTPKVAAISSRIMAGASVAGVTLVPRQVSSCPPPTTLCACLRRRACCARQAVRPC